MNPKKTNAHKSVIRLQRTFRCRSCARVEAFEPYAEPTCCHQPMDPDDELQYLGGDPEQHRIDLIHMPHPSSRHHGIEDAIYRADFEAVVRRFDRSYDKAADSVHEVYFLRPGRRHGERIGWVLVTPLAWHWYMTSGVKTAKGTATGSVECLDAMVTALDEG